MRSVLVIVVAWSLAVGLSVSLAWTTGCTSPHSGRCKDICQREAKCVSEQEDSDILFDENECVAACASLERDSDGKQLVDKHEQCVNAANSCSALLACP